MASIRPPSNFGKTKFSVLYLGKDENLEHKVRNVLGTNISNYLIAEDCEKALSLFKTNLVDVVITDSYFLSQMPECTIHKLRRINPDVNIVLLNEQYEIISSPFDLPCLAKAQRPLRPSSLANLFNTVSDGSKESDNTDLIKLTSSAFFHSSVAMTIKSWQSILLSLKS